MDTSTRAWRYDIFKLVVAILLLILFFLLLRKPTLIPLTTAQATPSSNGTMPAAPSMTLDVNPVAVQSTSTRAPAPTPPTESTPADSPPSTMAADTDTPTARPSPSPTKTTPTTPTPLPTPLPTTADIPLMEFTPTSTEEPPSAMTACEIAASRSRLQTGMRATILRRLNFRSSPGIRDNWLRTNLPGTIIEVVGGPECLPHSTGAYVWWQIRLPNGEIGWSAEGSVHGTFYFMEPGQ